MRTVCRGDCARSAVPKLIGTMYARGFGWCTTCAEWFELRYASCPCCARPLRRRPRSNAGCGDLPPPRRAPLPPTAAVIQAASIVGRASD